MNFIPSLSVSWVWDILMFADMKSTGLIVDIVQMSSIFFSAEKMINSDPSSINRLTVEPP